jgi:glutamyl-tRNA synthetase
MREVVDSSGWSAGQFFGILRMAITGQKVSPPLFESIEIIKKNVVIERLESALKILKGG